LGCQNRPTLDRPDLDPARHADPLDQRVHPPDRRRPIARGTRAHARPRLAPPRAPPAPDRHTQARHAAPGRLTPPRQGMRLPGTRLPDPRFSRFSLRRNRSGSGTPGVPRSWPTLGQLWTFLGIFLPALAALLVPMPAVDLAYQLRAGAGILA